MASQHICADKIGDTGFCFLHLSSFGEVLNVHFWSKQTQNSPMRVLSALEICFIGDSGFVGTIPTEIGMLQQLTGLSVCKCWRLNTYFEKLALRRRI